jgi:hypothetical protein
MRPEKTQSAEPDKREPVSFSIPEAGWHYFGYGRAASYNAAKRGDLITVGTGDRWRRVPRAAMDRKFLEAGQVPAGRSQPAA